MIMGTSVLTITDVAIITVKRPLGGYNQNNDYPDIMRSHSPLCYFPIYFKNIHNAEAFDNISIKLGFVV